ncbi:MAG: hypothetical protein ACWGQW_03270 [bacterium]
MKLLDKIISPSDQIAMEFWWRIIYKPFFAVLLTVILATAFIGSYAYFAYYFFTTSPC